MKKQLISISTALVVTIMLWGDFIFAFIYTIITEGGYFPGPEKASWLDIPIFMMISLTFIIMYVSLRFLITYSNKNAQ